MGYNNGIGISQLAFNIGKGVNFLNSIAYAGILGGTANTALFSEGFADIAYDPTCKLLYVAYCDQKPIFFDDGNFPPNTLTNMTIYVITSRNHGKTWSNQRQVSKYITNGRGIVTISVDPTLGVVSVCWLDAHIDTNLTGNVQPYRATFKSELF
jgi:hypothetical protein